MAQINIKDPAKFLAALEPLAENEAYLALVDYLRQCQQEAWHAVREKLCPLGQAKLDLLDDVLGTLPGTRPARESLIERTEASQRQRLNAEILGIAKRKKGRPT